MLYHRNSDMLHYNFIVECILECLTVGGADPNVPCIFPFIIDGNSYTECVVDQYGKWCSTGVDSQGVHLAGQGKWGDCGPGCPIPPPGIPITSSCCSFFIMFFVN